MNRDEAEPPPEGTEMPLTIVEAEMMSDKELTAVAASAYFEVIEANPDAVRQPGLLAQIIDERTGVGFERAALVVLSAPAPA